MMNFKYGKSIGAFTLILSVTCGQAGVFSKLDSCSRYIDMYGNWFFPACESVLKNKLEQHKSHTIHARIVADPARHLTDPFLRAIIGDQLRQRGVDNPEQYTILLGGHDVDGDFAAVAEGKLVYIWPSLVEAVSEIAQQLENNLGRAATIEDVHTVATLKSRLTEEQWQDLQQQIQLLFCLKFMVRHEAGHLLANDFERHMHMQTSVYKILPWVLVDFCIMYAQNMQVDKIQRDWLRLLVRTIATNCHYTTTRYLFTVANSLMMARALKRHEMVADLGAIETCTDADELRFVAALWGSKNKEVYQMLSQWNEKYKELSTAGTFEYSKFLYKKAMTNDAKFLPFYWYMWRNANAYVDWSQDAIAATKMQPTYPSYQQREDLCLEAAEKIERARLS